MATPDAPLLVDLRPLGWDAARSAAALAGAGPNEQRVRAAALALADAHDHPAAFARWLDAQAPGPQRPASGDE